ncbi:phospholipase D family protein [Meiothermus sp. CFH 77666]|uniref:phospholipase D family protein n=1 Tax=Meiothermus sp. CFH 77666 TaxID=2817942 RepID=UPI001AA030D4|nr:phospholipase D family protein [Meiothermus sp. CFH 77666]MBO1438667.1 phospholipase D family protein [Meiothermus sp. CFH 77666]
MPIKAILATGDRLVGGGVRSFDAVIEELIGAASNEIQIAAYSFDPSFVGILKDIARKSRSGIRVTLITRAISAQHQIVQAALKSLAEEQAVFEFPDSSNGRLHMKVLVVDRNDAVIGSANFTAGGLVNNHELGVWLTGPEAWQVSNLLDQLIVTR